MHSDATGAPPYVPSVIITPTLDNKALALLQEVVDNYELADKAPAVYMADLGRLAVALLMEAMSRKRLKSADHITILRIVTEFYKKSGVTIEPGDTQNFTFNVGPPA